MKPTLLILAAGMGSRYQGLKQMDTFGPSGEAIIDYSIYDAIRAGFGKIVFVISKKIEAEFKELFIDKLKGKIEISYVLQEIDNLPNGFEVPADRIKPWGTGHAVLVAASEIDTPFAVINADDFYGQHSFEVLADYLKDMDLGTTDYCMVGYKLENTLSEHGSVSRGICVTDRGDFLQSITERTKINQIEGDIGYEEEGNRVPLTGNEVASMNMMGFPPSVMAHYESQFKEFLKERCTELKSEFYIPTVVNNLIHSGGARMKVLNTPEKWFGVTYRDDKVIAVKKLEELVEAGVYPANLWG